MQVIVAETAGFCKGVRTALELTLEAARKAPEGEILCTFGPLIHNRQVLEMLEERGVREVRTVEECAGKKVIVRAHGIPPEQRRELRAVSTGLVDATCKRVARVQAIIRKHARKGGHTVIAGDADHAEVIGLMGYTEGLGRVVRQPDEIDSLPAHWERVLLVAQTTQNEEVFQEIERRFRKRYPQGIVHNTICGATHERQAEVKRIARQVDAMVIVGGFHSGNTVRLAEVARECGVPTYHVETEQDLSPRQMGRYAKVGVSAGASTPNWMIRNVVRFLEGIRSEEALGRRSWARWAETAAYSNLGGALGAAWLTAAVSALTRLPSTLQDAFMAGAYVFAMHTLNRYLDREATQLNDPERAAFYRRWRLPLMSASLLAAALALVLAFWRGPLSFFAMVLLVFFGMIYTVPILQPHWRQSLSALKIKDIPASKTLTVPLAWASVTVFIPHLDHIDDAFGSILLVFIVVFLLVLMRTAFMDCLDIQGDRLVGRETVVVLLGENETIRYLWIVLAALSGTLLGGAWLGALTPFAFFLLPAAGVYAWFLRTTHGRRIHQAPVLEILIELVIVGIGVMGLVWNFIT